MIWLSRECAKNLKIIIGDAFWLFFFFFVGFYFGFHLLTGKQLFGPDCVDNLLFGDLLFEKSVHTHQVPGGLFFE